jgi:hypothetical protein
MITFLIYTFFKKNRNQKWTETVLQKRKYLIVSFEFIFIVLLVIQLALIPVLSRGQTMRLNYKITKGGDEIGWLRLEKNITGSTTRLLLVSEIKTRFIFLITALAKDSSAFINRKMIYSSQFRQTNGSTKLNNQTRLVGDKYVVHEDGAQENLSIPFISINLLGLYFQEPVGINMVYCDINKSFAPIVRTSDGGYKVKRPDGNSNTFYYSRGTCMKVIICQSFYTVTVILNQ